MKPIQLLDNHTINKIAAGEVVESPKSVVKELVENSIDAGSSAITIEIKEGGISYIRVSDNGCGIPKEQAKSAFLRHATSKMQVIEDLEKICSLGFRGEALASIAAVAQIEMTTKTSEDELGTYIEIAGGNITAMKDMACTEGTSIVVKNLFYNVPARRKFLKKPSAESSQISDIVNKIALGHPEISFRYINNQTDILHTSGNSDYKTSVFYVYGRETAEKTLPLSYKNKNYELSGLIGKPELSRANRNYENLFINGRFVKNSIVSSAIEDAYKTRLMVGKFPVYMLHFKIPPHLVDVNVHPSKLEVRFHDDNEIYEFFYHAVATTLQENILIPKVSWGNETTEISEISEISKEENKKQAVKKEVAAPVPEKPVEAVIPDLDLLEIQSPPNTAGKSIKDLLHPSINTYLTLEEPKTEYNTAPAKQSTLSFEEQTKNEIKPFFHNYKMIGQVFSTYWIVEQSGSLFIIDQHAAHERILFEQLMEHFQKERVQRQRMLEPVLLQLTEVEQTVIQENIDLFEKFGFEIEAFDQRTFALQTVPFILRGPVSTDFFTEILDILSDGNLKNLFDTKIMTIATMACKAAVKANDTLSIQEASSMIGQLLKLENPFTCPHGRPTVIEMTKYELEKKFKRIQN